MERVKNLKSQISLAENALLGLNKEAKRFVCLHPEYRKRYRLRRTRQRHNRQRQHPRRRPSAEKTLAACLESLANLEREQEGRSTGFPLSPKRRQNSTKRAQYLSFEHKKARDEANALYIKVKLEQKDNFAKLAELTSQIEPKLLERYKALREQTPYTRHWGVP